MRLTTLALVASAVAADVCLFNRTANSCPGEGAPCSEKVLCSSGLYCKVTDVGQNKKSYSGRCAKGPALEDVYNKPCDIGKDEIGCQFDDPLGLSPYALPRNLQCVRSTYTLNAGTCLLGPQKHGDGCNQEGECASGNCLKELRICAGVDEGEKCTPGYPDPCASDHFCAPTNAGGGGICQKAVTAGRPCSWNTACERGTYCAGTSLDSRRCVPMFSVETGQNTTVGPYMCKTGNAVIVQAGVDLPSSLYQCVDANSTKVGAECSTRSPAPMGYECKCAADGKTRLRTVMALGLGGRSAAWKDLYTCLLTATGPMGDLCEFDSTDMEGVRYGSCAFYGCYPQYLALVNATGGRVFAPPLDQFEPTAACELAAAKSYYQEVASTACIRIPNMENWKCASLLGPHSLSVQDTAGVISFIFIVVWGSYWYHMYHFRKANKTKLPCIVN